MKDPLEKSMDAKDMEAEILAIHNEICHDGNALYRGCEITPYPGIAGHKSCDFEWTHQDYDGPNDEGDITSPTLCGCGESIADCKEQIDELMAEIEDELDTFEDEMREGKFDIVRTIKEHG